MLCIYRYPPRGVGTGDQIEIPSLEYLGVQVLYRYSPFPREYYTPWWGLVSPVIGCSPGGKGIAVRREQAALRRPQPNSRTVSKGELSVPGLPSMGPLPGYPLIPVFPFQLFRDSPSVSRGELSLPG